MPDFTAWMTWDTWSRVIWTVATISVACGGGLAISAIVRSRLTRWVIQAGRPLLARTIGRLRRRLPLWTGLIGVYLAAGYWPLTAEAHLLVERVLFAVAVTSVTLAVSSLLTGVVDAYASTIATAVPVTSLTRNIVRGVVATFGLLIVLNGLGISITPMLTALGVGGLAVALALQEPLANFFAGLFVTLGGQIRVGDYVRLESGQEGYVTDFSWRSTRLRMLANNLVVVPNAKLAQAIVVNHSLPGQDLAVLVEVGVDYASDLEHVQRVTCEVGREVMSTVEGGVDEFTPFIRYHTFGQSSVDFTVILRARTFVDQYFVKHEFVKRLHVRFNREGIVIPFPIRTLVTRTEPAPTGPAHGVEA